MNPYETELGKSVLVNEYTMPFSVRSRWLARPLSAEWGHGIPRPKQCEIMEMDGHVCLLYISLYMFSPKTFETYVCCNRKSIDIIQTNV